MSDHRIVLQTSQDLLAVCRLLPTSALPSWVNFEADGFISVTKTPDGLSIVCNQDIVPPSVKAEKSWRIIRIKGQLDFSLVGILKRVITPLSDNGISIYTISTYDTDYILIKDEQFNFALNELQKHFTIDS